MAHVSVDELMETILRLSDLLAKESDMLDSMKLKDLHTLQDEKQRLTKTLETYQQVMATRPEFLRGTDADTRKELLLRTDDLAITVEENFHRTAVARAVNQRIMQAITDVLSEQHSPGTYGPQGFATVPSDIALSINLNQKA
jgi:flagellar biosynthesis/type III secretory pathway chaperone